MMMGVPIRVVMEIMGHSSISMTSKYQHVVDAALDDAAERLAHIFPVATPVATPAAETGA
jgi:site-specific recombinase XerD